MIYASPSGARAIERRYRELLELWPVPHEQVRVPTAHGETFVVACGAAGAPPLVLPHGSGANSAMWLGDVAVWARGFGPRRGRLPVFSDEELGRLGMPVLVIAGERDGLLDSHGTRRRLPRADVRVLPGVGHLLPPRTQPIMDFLETSHD